MRERENLTSNFQLSNRIRNSPGVPSHQTECQVPVCGCRPSDSRIWRVGFREASCVRRLAAFRFPSGSCVSSVSTPGHKKASPPQFPPIMTLYPPAIHLCTVTISLPQVLTISRERSHLCLHWCAPTFRHPPPLDSAIPVTPSPTKTVLVPRT